MMTIERLIMNKRLVNEYVTAENKFHDEFEKADTLEKQLNAYSAQVGRLEAILDVLKISIKEFNNDR
ncbi:MAG: hypothetical protein IKF11_10800 [Methanobrevibacter sp.]|nr:hypothetical protein [Methanobrevibacter sp.]